MARNSKMPMMEKASAYPVIPAFQLDEPPSSFSEEWEWRQIRKLSDFHLYTEAKRQLLLWEDVIHDREIAFVHTLSDSPFVQAYLLCHVKWKYRFPNSCLPEEWNYKRFGSYSPDEAGPVWGLCLRAKRLSPEKRKKRLLDRLSEMTPAQQFIAKDARVLENFDQLEAQFLRAKEQFDRIREELHESIFARLKQEKDAAWAAYDNHMDTLSSAQKRHAFFTEYERAKADRAAAQRYLLGENQTSPFHFCGWANYINPDWPEAYNRCTGTAYQIRKSCFGKRNPLLYYRGGARGIEAVKLYAENIQKYSSGIRILEVNSSDCNADFTFRLDPDFLRETMVLEGKNIHTSALGEPYVLVLPVTGEFNCELGEILEGRRFPLAHDHFLADSLAALQNDLNQQASDPTFRGCTRMTNIRF